MTHHKNDQNIILAGHRGMGCTDHEFYQSMRDVKKLPVENTVNAVRLALENGAAYVEIDALMSRDGVIFTLHNVVIADHFFADEKPDNDLNTLDFEVINNFKTGRYSNGDIASLLDVLNTVDQHGPKSLNFDVNIEIKGVQGSNQNFEDNDFIEQIADIAKASDIPVERILFSSFCLMNIVRMSHFLPNAQFGMLFTQHHDHEKPIYKNHVGEMAYQYVSLTIESVNDVLGYWQENAHQDAVISYCHPEISTLTEDLIFSLKKNNKGLNCWALFETLDTDRKNHYKNINQLCADHDVSITVITDYLEEMTAFLKTLSSSE